MSFASWIEDEDTTLVPNTMDEYWKNDFVETAVNYAGVSTEKALELWEEHGEDLMEDIYTAADALMQEIFDKEKQNG